MASIEQVYNYISPFKSSIYTGFKGGGGGIFFSWKKINFTFISVVVGESYLQINFKKWLNLKRCGVYFYLVLSQKCLFLR